MKNATKRVEEEEVRIIFHDNAIYNLELAIRDRRRILEAHDKKDFNPNECERVNIRYISSLLTKPEQISEALCIELKACFVMPAANNWRWT
jgi:hypothetical protein